MDDNDRYRHNLNKILHIYEDLGGEIDWDNEDKYPKSIKLYEELKEVLFKDV